METNPPGLKLWKSGVDEMKTRITFGEGLLWVLIWFGFMLLYTFLDVAVWRRLAPAREKPLHILTIALSIVAYLKLLAQKGHFKVDLLGNASSAGILLAAGCAILLYFLLDKGLDPVFERAFPASEESYQETLQSLRGAPVSSLLQVCILAPLIEEILIRGYLLGGLSAGYGNVIALLVSALLFALLHFNMVQTLSAFVCGIALGLLYLQTRSVLCCILAHAGYNLISYITMIAPLFSKH